MREQRNPELLAVELFDCPTCSAKKGTACETPAGRPRQPHDNRFAMVLLRQMEAEKWASFTGQRLVDSPDYSRPLRRARRAK